MDEKEILKFWKENKIFDKTLAKDSPSGEFVFTTVRRLPPVCLITAVCWPPSPRMFLPLQNHARFSCQTAMGLGLPWPAYRKYD